MPSGCPTAAQIWNGEIGFFSLDTDVLQSKGFKFEEPPLSQLPKQLPKNMSLQFSPVVLEEILGHRMKPVADARAKLEAALAALKRLTGFDVAHIEKTYEGDGLAAIARDKFENDVMAYVEECRGDLLEYGPGTAENVFQLYFLQRPPFEEKKKSEFPDAASLVLLEQYANMHSVKGVVVSNDQGWAKFCESSEVLYCVRSIEELASLFSATDDVAVQVKLQVIKAIDDKFSPLRTEITEKLKEHYAESEWSVGEINSVNTDRVDAEVGHASMLEYKVVSDHTEIWSDEDDPTEWIIELTVEAKIEVSVYVEFYKWDWIDREEIRLGSDVVDVYETVLTEVYITCGEVIPESSPEQWKIDIEIGYGGYDLSEMTVEMDLYG